MNKLFQTAAMQDMALSAPIQLDVLPSHISGAIKAFQRDNPRADQSSVLSAREAIEMWLQWNGIIGYTDQIISVVMTCWSLGASIIDTERGAFRHG